MLQRFALALNQGLFGRRAGACFCAAVSHRSGYSGEIPWGVDSGSAFAKVQLLTPTLEATVKLTAIKCTITGTLLYRTLYNVCPEADDALLIFWRYRYFSWCN